MALYMSTRWSKGLARSESRPDSTVERTPIVLLGRSQDDHNLLLE